MSPDQIFRENMAQNIKEIQDKKTVLLSKPRKLNVALTTRCNLSCIMCEARKINWEIPKNTIDEIILLFPYLERIIWQGGEVFLFDSFKEILQQASPYQNLTHEITTNGHLITEDWIGLIKKINLDMNISVDAFSQETYERIRKGSKFSEILKLLGRISEIKKESGSKVFVLIFTLMKSNFRELPGIVDFAKRFNFDRVIIQPVKGNYNNDENIFHYRNSEALEYIEKIKPKLKEEAHDQGIHLVEWLPKCASINPKEEKSIPGFKNGLFCYAPWQQLFIEWGGNVYPHCLCLEDGPNEKRKIGSVLESSLIEIWNNQKMQIFRKKIIDNDFRDLCSPDCVCGLITANLRNLPSGPDNLNKPKAQTDDLATLFQKGKGHIAEKNYDLALKQFEEIVGLYPDNSEAHFELGKAHYLKGNHPFAIKELLEARRINPQDASSRLLLAKLYKAAAKYEFAFEEIEPLVTNHLHSADPEIFKELRDIYPGYLRELKDYNNRGEFAKVAKKAKRLYEVIPKDDIFYRNKALSELEIAQKKLVVSAKMRNLIVTLSTACNLNCVMCEERRLNWEIPKNILEEVITYFPYLERLVWQGGEAFLVDYFDELIEEAAKFPHLRQVITTNGLLIDERRAEKLVKSNVDLTFSIDGVTKDIYEKIRQGANFEVLMRNLDNFNKTRKKYNNLLLNTNLHAVIMRSNYHQLEEYIEFAKEHEFKLIAFLPIGGNFDNPENIFYSQDEKAFKFIEKVIPGIEEKARKYGILLENRLPVKKTKEPINTDKAMSQVENANFDNGMLCHLPWIQLYIDYDGSIRPDCVCRPEKSIGHVSKNSLAEVWNNELMQRYRKIIIDNCCSEICNLECVRGQVSERYLKFS
jgi:MoaA/NifB/PqqE/SkfB family radical SAM enzyme